MGFDKDSGANPRLQIGDGALPQTRPFGVAD
jgi:hypothetical protein